MLLVGDGTPMSLTHWSGKATKAYKREYADGDENLTYIYQHAGEK